MNNSELQEGPNQRDITKRTRLTRARFHIAVRNTMREADIFRNAKMADMHSC